MGFFLRKSIKLGPLRVNLSKSGLGASFGVKGLRTGLDAKGRGYVAGGRGGLYFREYAKPPEAGQEGSAPEIPPTSSSSRSSALPWILLAIAVAVILLLLVR